MNSYTVVRESDARIIDRVDFWGVLDRYTHQDSLETPQGVIGALGRLSKYASTIEGATLSPDFRVFASPRRAAMWAHVRLNRDLCRVEEELEAEIMVHEESGDSATVRNLETTHARVRDSRTGLIGMDA